MSASESFASVLGSVDVVRVAVGVAVAVGVDVVRVGVDVVRVGVGVGVGVDVVHVGVGVVFSKKVAESEASISMKVLRDVSIIAPPCLLLPSFAAVVVVVVVVAVVVVVQHQLREEPLFMTLEKAQLNRDQFFLLPSSNHLLLSFTPS